MRSSSFMVMLGLFAAAGFGVASAQDEAGAPGAAAPETASESGEGGKAGEGADGATPPPGDGMSFEITGIDVDAYGKNSTAARNAAYRQAQREGWRMLYGRMTGKGAQAAPRLADSALDAMVSGIIVENEQIGPNRYIGRLGVMFDRARAGQLLGIGGQVMRSPPMLTIPVIYDGGAAQSFEQRTPWSRAWGRFRAGSSPIDYIRPAGTAQDAALLSAAQTRRPSRDWWLMLLDQYGASDVLVVEARLERQWPGGPVIGHFTARHGPDALVIQHFSLRIASSAALDQMFDTAVQRIDAAYAGALRDGRLKPDPALRFDDIPQIDIAPDISGGEAIGDMVVGSIEVLVDTPDAPALSTAEGILRATPGVAGTQLLSLSLGTQSRLQLRYSGSMELLRWNLDQRGWRLEGGPDGLKMRRRRADEQPLPAPPPPPPPVATPAPAPAAPGPATPPAR